jgi:hypothetical protein
MWDSESQFREETMKPSSDRRRAACQQAAVEEGVPEEIGKTPEMM